MRTGKRRLFAYVAVFLCSSVMALVIYVIRADAHKTVEAVIQNHGPYEMENVIVRVTGNQYQLGRIGKGSRALAQVRAKGDSDIKISYDRSDKAYSLIVDCYLESGYSGSIEVEIENDRIAKVTDKIQLPH